MKKFLAWIKSPSSDSVLFIILLVLANIVGQRAFLRFDLTGPKSYSLSPVSVQLVKTLREPLSIKVFFSENLPAPYNSVEQYLSDLLVEYKGAANRNFSYAFFDM
ncbi:MAG TPA: ABC transporter, partial [Spirochaetaceae bacterium]|nr:ABC transporter [Spirochaetaceae bacterium]